MQPYYYNSPYVQWVPPPAPIPSPKVSSSTSVPQFVPVVSHSPPFVSGSGEYGGGKHWNYGIFLYALIAIAVLFLLIGGGFLYGLTVNNESEEDPVPASRTRQRNVLYLISGASILCALFIFILILVS